MSHSINYQFLHLMFPTKNLLPLIFQETQNALLAYISGIVTGLGGRLLASSSSSNHIHLLVNSPLELSIVELLCQIKSRSSKWYRTKGNNHLEFSWNEGYSAFTVSPDSVENVIKYLANEKIRHSNLSYEEELLSFLKFQEIEYNPKFITNTTHTKMFLHLVWSVKNREPMIVDELKVPLQQHIQQEVQKNGAKLCAIGNVADHIHLLVETSGKVATSQMMQQIKTSTTHLIKSKNKRLSDFSWQEGYGAFSVGKPAFKIVANYVNNQEHHHKMKSFEVEWDLLRGKKFSFH